MDLESLFPERSAIPAAHVQKRVDQREYLIDGKILTWAGPVQEIVSPVCLRDGAALKPEIIGSTPLLDEKTGLEALDAAVRAWGLGRGAWPSMRVEERIRAVQTFALKMQERREEVVRLLMWEIGKTYADSCKEFDRTVQYITDTIEALKEADRVSSRFQIVEGIVAQVRRAPLGVVLCMGPFNYPLNETFTTLIPALIMGNTVLFKPAKYGVLLNGPLLEAFRDSFPSGVVNTLYGEGRTLIGPIMATGKVDCLAFIGSAKTSVVIEKQHPMPNRLRTVLGLNAKNPGIVLPDADMDNAVKECVTGSLSFNGQRCTALKLIFVHRSVADAFLAKLCAAVDALKVGMPWEEGVKITPLPEEGKTDWLKSMMDDAVAKGAKLMNAGGGKIAATLFTPAVLYPVKPGMKLWDEEQFGPLVAVAPYDDESEVLDYVAASNFGQQASIFGTDPDKVARLVDALSMQVCRVNVNSQCQRGPDVFPFTGRKDSADGTLSVSDALRVFSIRSMVAAKKGEANDALVRAIVEGRKSVFLNTDFIL